MRTSLHHLWLCMAVEQMGVKGTSEFGILCQVHWVLVLRNSEVCY